MDHILKIGSFWSYTLNDIIKLGPLRFQRILSDMPIYLTGYSRNLYFSTMFRYLRDPRQILLLILNEFKRII